MIQKQLKTLVPWLKQNYNKPPTIVKAKDEYLYDVSGKRYVDFTSGLMVVNLGHGNQEIIAGITNQLATGLEYVPPNYPTQTREDLSSSLLSLTSMPDGKVFYTNGGADANEIAMFLAVETHKIKTGSTKKKRILTFKNSFLILLSIFKLVLIFCAPSITITISPFK